MSEYGDLDLADELMALRAENARLRIRAAREREVAALIVEGFCTAMNNPVIAAILDGDYEALVDRDFAMAAAIRKSIEDKFADASMGETE